MHLVTRQPGVNPSPICKFSSMCTSPTPTVLIKIGVVLWWPLSCCELINLDQLSKETLGKQFSCQEQPVLLLKSSTEDKDGRAARSIEQSETEEKIRPKTEQTPGIMGLEREWAYFLEPESERCGCAWFKMCDYEGKSFCFTLSKWAPLSPASSTGASLRNSAGSSVD